MTQVLVLHGPNLNLLGQREPDIYGRTSLAEINAQLQQLASSCDIELDCFQSNAEHELINRIHEAGQDGTDWLIINPAAFTHTSVALRDALAAVACPFIEVHLSNPEAREPFRHQSLLADLATGRISGLGAEGYLLALQAIINKD